MKIFKLFVAIAALALSIGVQAAETRYDFALTAEPGYSISGYFTGTFDSTASTFQAPTTFAGNLIRAAGSTADAKIVSGSISGLTVSTDGTGWMLGFTVTSGTLITSYLWNSGVDGYFGTTPSGGKSVSAELDTVAVKYSTTNTSTTDSIAGTPTPYISVAVPEIDGSKLPQAALLILALVFMVRRVTAARPTAGFSTQFA